MSNFDWLSEIPDEWEPPDELLNPSVSAEINLAIRMLSCDYLGHEVLVLIGRFVAEHSLYALWFLKEMKTANHGLKETITLTGIPLERTRTIYEAWRRFEEVSDAQEADVIVGERRQAARQELSAALQAAITTLEQTRTMT